MPMERLPRPGAVPRLRAFEDTLTAFRNQDTGAPCPGLGPSEVSAVVTEQLAFLRIKTQWAHEPPFLIWQVDKPEVARSFLDMHDQQVSDGGQPHRVTQHFAGSTSRLRRHMEAFAAGHGMSPWLRAEVTSYQCCILDDTWVEAVHRDLSGTGRKKAMSMMPYRFATLRLGQNLELCEGLSATERHALEQVIWQRWRAIARPATPRIPKRPLWDCQKMSIRAVRTQVYRLGQAALVDWASTLPPLTNVHGETPETRASPRWAKALQWDFMNTLVEFLGNESVLSIPDQEDSSLPNPSTATTQRFFQVVMGAEVRRKKQLRTAWSTRIASMAYPAMVQNMAIWSRRGDDTWDVYPDGHPDVEDLVRCAPWRQVRADMAVWTLVPADTAGCVSLGSPQKVMDIPWNLRTGPVPLVVVLEHLARAGWQRASSAKDSLAIHTLDTPKVMYLCGRNAQDKAYVQCLACLEDILTPSLPSLATMKPAAYYLNILQPQLDLVVLPPPGQDSGNHEARARDSSEEEPVLDYSTRPCVGHPTSRASRKRKLTEASGINDSLLVPLPAIERSRPDAPPGQPAAAVEDAAPPGQPAASSSSQLVPLEHSPPGQPAAAGAASSSVPLEHPPPGQPAAARRARRRVRDSVPREILANVEGVNIVRDTHLEPGMAGHYNRARVECRLHSLPEADIFCHKSRVFGPRTTASFGQQEPVAFLASWICAASRFKDKASHMEHCPSHAEVGAAIAGLEG